MNVNRIRPLIQELLSAERMVGADLGARYDLPTPWRVLDGAAHFISFEPDLKACEALEKTYAARGHGDMYTVRPVAVTGEGGDRTLYITHAPSGSSLFDPDTKVNQEHVDRGYIYPIRTEVVQTSAVRAEFESLGETDVDLMKLDIQGCELDVLEGLGDEMLDNLLCVELEAAMRPRGKGYPTFDDIHRLLTGRGFELVNLWPVCVHRTRNGSRAGYLRDMLGVRPRSPSVSARAWEADMLYARSYDPLLESGRLGKVLKLAVCMGSYGYYLESLHLIDGAAERGLLDESRADRLRQCVVEWHSLAHCKPWHREGLLGDIVERVLTAMKVDPGAHGSINRHRS